MKLCERCVSTTATAIERISSSREDCGSHHNGGIDRHSHSLKLEGHLPAIHTGLLMSKCSFTAYAGVLEGWWLVRPRIEPPMTVGKFTSAGDDLGKVVDMGSVAKKNVRV
jgi:hypothetical protein